MHNSIELEWLTKTHNSKYANIQGLQKYMEKKLCV